MFCSNCGNKQCDTCKLKYPKLLTSKTAHVKSSKIGECSCCGKVELVMGKVGKKVLCTECFADNLVSMFV